MKKKRTKEVKLVDIIKIRFAPEIEVEFPHSKDSQKLIDRHRVLDGWTITYDGSLENGAEYKPKDKNHLYYNEESLIQIKEILALIRVHRGRISRRCGLHIHIDCKGLSDEIVLRIIKEFIHKQRYIVKRFNIDKGRLEETCKLLPFENLNKLTKKHISDYRKDNQSDWFSGYSYLDEKYYSLNASHLRKGDYGTLEFRLFDATTSFKKIKDQILFALNFVKDAIERDE